MPVTIRCKTDFVSCLWSKISQMVFRFSICLSFNTFGTHFPDFCIFPIALKRSEIVCCATFNISAICFWLKVGSSSNIVCNSMSSNFFGGLPRSSFLTSKSPSLNRRNHLLHVASDRAWSPYASTSIRCDSAALFFKWKQKIKALRKSSVSGTKSVIFNLMKKCDVVCPLIWCILNMFDRWQTNAKKASSHLYFDAQFIPVHLAPLFHVLICTLSFYWIERKNNTPKKLFFSKEESKIVSKESAYTILKVIVLYTNFKEK